MFIFSASVLTRNVAEATLQPSILTLTILKQAAVAGYEVFGPGQPPQLCVNLELNRFADKGVTMLQQRGPVFPGEEEAFAKELVRWARESGFKVKRAFFSFGGGRGGLSTLY